MRLRLFVAGAVVFLGCFAAHADTGVPTGTLSGSTLLASSGWQQDSDSGFSYIESVYRDGSTGNMDFVIQVSNPDAAPWNLGTSVTNTDFSGYMTSFGYEDDGNTAPDSASETAGAVTFTFNLFAGDETDPLIIYTNAANYGPGGLTFDFEGSDPPGFAPAGALATTPEPSSIALLGSGVLGLGGVLRRRLARS